MEISWRNGLFHAKCSTKINIHNCGLCFHSEKTCDFVSFLGTVSIITIQLFYTKFPRNTVCKLSFKQIMREMEKCGLMWLRWSRGKPWTPQMALLREVVFYHISKWALLPLRPEIAKSSWAGSRVSLKDQERLYLSCADSAWVKKINCWQHSCWAVPTIYPPHMAGSALWIQPRSSWKAVMDTHRLFLVPDPK